MVPGFNILPNPLSPSPLWERELMVPGFNILPNPPFSLSPMGRGQG